MVYRKEHLSMENLQTILPLLQEWVVGFGLKAIAAIVILILGLRLAKTGRRGLERLMSRSSLDPTLSRFAANVTEVGLGIITLILVLGQMGIETASFLTVLASAGLAVGLALQGSLSNLAAGVLLIIFRPFRVGDYIESGGFAGSVEEIQLLVTLLATPDNRVVIVPNSKLVAEVVINYSVKSTRRLDLIFGVAYGEDLERVHTIIAQVVAEDDRILADPAPTIGVIGLGDNSVNFAVRPWVQRDDFLNVMMDLQGRMKTRFDQEGISIPFPQREVRMIHQQLPIN